jgi:hypothetical protein
VATIAQYFGDRDAREKMAACSAACDHCIHAPLLRLV